MVIFTQSCTAYCIVEYLLNVPEDMEDKLIIFKILLDNLTTSWHKSITVQTSPVPVLVPKESMHNMFVRGSSDLEGDSPKWAQVIISLHNL